MYMLASIIPLLTGFAAILFIIWSFFGVLISKDRRRLYSKRAGFGLLALVVSFVLFSVLAVFDQSSTAKQAGFDTMTDYQAAKKAGISDPTIWKARREELKQSEDAAAAARKVEAERSAAAKAAETERAVGAAAAEEEKRLADEKPQKKEAESVCLADLTCLWKEQSVYMTAECRIAVQNLAKWDYEWTYGWTERAFNPVWLEKGNGLVLLSGDKLKLQNGFGAWKHVSYLCTYNPTTKRAIEATIVQ